MTKPKKDNHKIVLTGGCFDILHYGHIYFLKKAKGLGSYLIIALESDANIKKLKGEGRPIHSQSQRREMLESLEFVDKVISLPDKMDDADYFNLVKTIQPSIIATTKGDPALIKKQKQAKIIGAQVIQIAKVRVPSTSQIAKILKIE
jgi:rfaE bifunctional protein nucleotidyltransferase chain/domain